MSNRQRLQEAYPEEKFLFADGFDEAIVGVDEAYFAQDDPAYPEAGKMRLIYSVKKCLAIIEAGMDPINPENEDDEYRDITGDAREHFDFNVSGGYLGSQTPVWLEDGFLEFE